ncbi:MFS polyamine transporter [Dendrothele bispora CBS 962.96]|uniref:MFS polyamine transporter n=1 Tax=Dendrothele bispora (strain CBS 962.96) TaxID=1314807 RepID=A0A4S8MD34_DENBC|nr:MFS polyamine transporter [Dendrothele bispora CBS 962.96]
MTLTKTDEKRTNADETPTPTIVEGRPSKTKDDSKVVVDEQPSESKPTDTSETIIVDWDGPQDPENPKMWKYKDKWAATAIVSMFTFISPVSSSMVAPATGTIADQFGITSTVQLAMVTSIFVLAYAVGPLILGPLSEIYGRSRVLQGANMFYLVWNLVCGFAQNEGQLIGFRFLAGLGGSAPLAVGGGVLGDVWLAEERGKAIAVYSLAPLLGPVVGPIAGAWIAQRSTWRWVFWSTSIVDAAIQVAGIFFLRETYAPFLLERKAQRIRKSLATDPEKAGLDVHVKTVFDGEHRSWRAIFSKALTRPFVLFVKEPIAQVIGLYMAFVYGIFYLFLTTIPTVFADVYHQAPGIAGLNYLALGVGLSLASQINARYMDKIYVYYKAKNGGVGEPEFRVPSMILGSIILPVGLFLNGWAAEKAVHWIVTDIGMAFIGAGVILTFQSMQTYVVDCFTLHAASALAAVSCLRSFAGFGFPLFAPTMYDHLGFGVGNSILAAVSIGIGVPAPILFWKYGKSIRGASKYARKSP